MTYIHGLDLGHFIRPLILAAVFIAPLHGTILYVPLIAALLLAAADWYLCGTRPTLPPFPMRCAAAGFFVCSCISVVCSVDPAFSAFNWVCLPCMYAGLYVLILTYIRTEAEERLLLGTILAGLLCVIVYGLVQFADFRSMAGIIADQDWVDPDRFPLLYRRMYSTLENPNLLAGYLIIMAGFFLPFAILERGKGRLGLWAILWGAALCLLLTYSRGAWISLALMAVLLGYLWDRRVWFLFLAVPPVLLLYHGQITERFLSLFSGEDTSTLMRIALWDSTAAMIADHPLTGVGWGAYFKVYPAYNYFIANPSVIIYHAHNMYLSMAADIGIPGALCWAVLFFGQGVLALRLYRRARSSFRRAVGLGTVLAVAAMAVYGVGDYVLFSRAVSFCFWAVCALAAVCEGAERAGKI